MQISRVTPGRGISRFACTAVTPPLGLVEAVQEHDGIFECRDIVLESGNRISVVDAHRFMLDSGRWIAAQDLRSGLRLKTPTGTVSIRSIAVRTAPYTGKVYNLKVRHSEQYLVGKDGIVARDW